MGWEWSTGCNDGHKTARKTPTRGGSHNQNYGHVIRVKGGDVGEEGAGVCEADRRRGVDQGDGYHEHSRTDEFLTFVVRCGHTGMDGLGVEHWL